MENIAKALIAAQKEMGNATKDSNNPFFKSKYADLNSIREACLPALNENGICVIQPICQIEGKNFVKTILLHESGETIESLTEILFAKQNDAQAQGSGITYARRYGLQALVCIGAEDDDGNKAAQPTTQQQKLSNVGDKDMQETLRKENEKQFARIKEALEGCGSVAEIEALSEKEKSQINKLARYANDLFLLLKDSKLDMIKQLDPEGEEVNTLQAG